MRSENAPGPVEYRTHLDLARKYERGLMVTARDPRAGAAVDTEWRNLVSEHEESQRGVAAAKSDEPNADAESPGAPVEGDSAPDPERRDHTVGMEKLAGVHRDKSPYPDD